MTLPLVEELVPAPDPWDVARRLAHLPHLLFLDSAEFHPELGRSSFSARPCSHSITLGISLFFLSPTGGEEYESDEGGTAMAYKGFDLGGKVSLITGGNGGIGFGMADALA